MAVLSTLASLLLAVSPPAFLLGGAPTSNGCESSPDCNTCLSASAGKTCGWCAVNTTTKTSVGPQCVDLHSTFDCNIQFQTDKCSSGWKCSHNHTNNASQCVPSVGGISDKQKCESNCAHPPPKPPSPSPPAPPKGSFKCDETSFKCAPAPFGDPTMKECESHCKQAYQCDQDKKMCNAVAANASGHVYYDKTTCMANCPLTPMPVPYELRGIWRGLSIQNSYATGEWVADITNNSVAIWYPDAASGAYKLYLKGTAQAQGIAGHYVLLVSSSAGKLTGTIRILAGDYSMQPEVKSFLQLAINEKNLGQEVASFDIAMSSHGATVLSFETCPGGAPPVPPPAPPGPPPPCKAKLDVALILDGSASIVASDWQKALQFVNKVVGSFVLAPDQVEIGIVQFSQTAAQVIGLSSDAAAITKAVTSLQQMKLNTNTYAGFKAAKDMIDQQGRPKTNGKLSIIITDGVQNEGLPAKQISDAMHQEGIETFGIGVGFQTDAKEIKSWCSAPVTDHYFSVAAFSDLEKILNQIVKNACKPHPPPPPPMPEPFRSNGHAAQAWNGESLAWAGDHYRGAAEGHYRMPRELMARLGNSSQNCKFRLPPNLPQKTRLNEVVADKEKANLPPIAAPAAEATPLVEAPVTPWTQTPDQCNAFKDCQSCTQQHTAGDTCGWCTGDITVAGQKTPYKCAGSAQGAASKFECTGHFQTSTCDIPGGCGINGTYRGLRIDNTFQFGEHQGVFSPQNTSEHVKFTQLDIAGKAAATLEGTVKCNAKCSTGKNNTGVPFTLTTVNGSIRHGICGYTEQIQAETAGLMWAISDDGVGTPPVGFDEAMLNTSKAEVFTYYKCSQYKKGTCVFTAV